MVNKLDFLANGFELSENHSSFLNSYSYNVANKPVWDLGPLNLLLNRVHNGLIWCVLGAGSSEGVEIPQLGYRMFESCEFFGIKNEDYPSGISLPLRIFYEHLGLILAESGYDISRMKHEVSERSDWVKQGLFLLDDFRQHQVLELTQKLRECFPGQMIKSQSAVSN